METKTSTKEVISIVIMKIRENNHQLRRTQ